MAEVVAGIGAAASIVQLIVFTTHVIRRLGEYREHTAEIPTVFRQIAIELPVLEHTLKQLQLSYDSGNIGAKTRAAIEPAIEECQQAVKTQDATFARLTPATTDSLRKKFGKALKGILQDSNVEKNIAKIRTLVHSLTLASYL
ncbi:hypothetical protein BDV95DRAFT_326705 [Massariosphaeria phaeospora]|uniref:NACHT-NTPase and P-loop NTPases N-terminal domain-containing protein n=1 Tax=Massariosphaeria phaeospora TaxID=100035 RepID=A0A7C8IDB1_9PLEO|nr:hypothetical protein BDV95DRAFT_326705 [Massariosphaeria phaeospora]